MGLAIITSNWSHGWIVPSTPSMASGNLRYPAGRPHPSSFLFMHTSDPLARNGRQKIARQVTFTYWLHRYSAN